MNFQNSLEEFNKNNLAKILYEFGYTAEEIKAIIIETFSPYFINKEKLEKNAINNLTSTFSSYLLVNRDFKDLIIYISQILDIYNEAKKKDANKTFKAYAEWSLDFSQSITLFWSIYNNQKNLKTLKNSYFILEVSSIIGRMIEGVIKPFLQFTLYLNDITTESNRSILNIKRENFGNIINDLCNIANLKEALSINNLKLHKWRNIAQHCAIKVLKDKVYYQLNNSNNIEVSKDELLLIAQRVNKIFSILRIAETIFFFDNQDDIIKQLHPNHLSVINIEEEGKLFDLYNNITTQGFNIIHLHYDEQNAIMKVQDLERYSDIEKKGIHSSQFLYHLWVLTKSKNLKVEYYLFKDIKFLTSEISSEKFEKNDNKDIAFHKLMDEIKYTFINEDICQNINPFKNIKIPKLLENSSGDYYSQKKEKLTISEFIHQFTLSVFCNYLALENEEFEDIDIYIGKDGALLKSIKPLSIILRVPATIESKELCTLILEVLDKTIKAYTTYQLEFDIVYQAKNNNYYFDKLAIIKSTKIEKENTTTL